MPKFEDKFVYFRWNDILKDKLCFLADNMEDLRKAFERGDRKLVKEEYSEAKPFKAKRGFYHFAYFDPNYDNKIAYEKGKQIEYKYIEGQWINISNPKWYDNIKYHVKPGISPAIVVLDRTDDEPRLIWVYMSEGKENRHVYFLGTPTECCSYILLHNNFANVMKAWEDGKTIQFLNKYSSEWTDVDGVPEWYDALQYRIKPESNKLATYKELSEWLAKGKGQYRNCFTATLMSTFLDYTFDADNEEVPEDYLVRPWGSDEWLVPTKEVLNG